MENTLGAPKAEFKAFPGSQTEDSNIMTIIPGYSALEIIGEDPREAASEKGLGLPGGIPERCFLDWSSSFESV